MCGVFDMSKVEVPVKFSGTEGFPARRDARYLKSLLRFAFSRISLRCIFSAAMSSPPPIVIVSACCSILMTVRSFWELYKKTLAEQEIDDRARSIYHNLREAHRYELMTDDEYHRWYYKYLVAKAEKNRKTYL